MNVTVNKIDAANIVVSGSIDNALLEEKVNKLAVKAGKEIKVDGFRKGKVPAHVVKQMHGEKLLQDAEQEALSTLMDEGIKEAGINAQDLIGQPTFLKYDKKEDTIDVEIELSSRPVIELKDYMEVVPSFEKPKADEKDVEAKLNEIASQQVSYTKIARKRMVRNGDMTLIDFEGFVDGVAFDGGKAEKFNLEIGSGSFIPGFEEQIIGMKYEEQKDVVVTFPEEYQAKELAGKEATFKVTLHEIQEKKETELTDEIAQKVLQDEKATLETLKEKVEAQVTSEAVSKLYNDELKPQMVEALVNKFDFALPNNIVEQEVDAKINALAQKMEEEELASYKENIDKVDELRNSVRDEAKDSVKATFIVDALAKEENVTVEDQEVSSALYYEAMMSQQDPQEVIKYYEDNNLLPAVKMGMIEDKLFGKMLGLEK
ncbi:MAG: Cell division trigger factor (EC [uncultured Sulfurovum sp.]|uniref:Trigger factor n=1 Tax=uncultured Sulfurovum sp. TaxID=269237 RepID=A0A6S6UIA0_9BACT|nr:MAG: Cell division trigger factor (EC [uncultured Sulfurovum sp.]